MYEDGDTFVNIILDGIFYASFQISVIYAYKILYIYWKPS